MIKGSIVALITPMTAAGAVNYDQIDELIDFHLQNGTAGIVAVGTTGESATLTHVEHQAVLSFIIKKVAGRIPIIAGTGSNSTNEAIELTQYAYKAGADVCLLLTPYYNKPTQAGLYQHYKAIAKSVPIPQMLYNVPGRTATDLLPKTVERLSSIDNIVAIKEATGSIERAKEILAFCDDQFCLYSGDDALGFELLKMGAMGCVSVTANIFPQALVNMYHAFFESNLEKATAIDNALQKIHTELFLESNPIPVKYLLSQIGMIQNVLRLPLTSLSNRYQKQLLQTYQESAQCLEGL